MSVYWDWTIHTHSKKNIPVVHNYEIEPENARKTQRKRYFVHRRGEMNTIWF
jgi:hypothetical protein